MDRNVRHESYQVEKGSTKVEVNIVTIVHGSLSPQEEQRATLIVIEFKFTSFNSSRRIRNAHISVDFDDAADVYAIAPDGSTYAPSSVVQTKTKYVTISVEPSLLEIGGIGRQWERTVTTTSRASINGQRMSSMGAPPFSYNRAAWTLSQNETAETGIPGYLRTAVLLRRDSSARFNATIAIEAELWGFKIMRQNIWDSIPMKIDPSNAPIGQPDGLIAANLGGIDLESLTDFKLSLNPSYAGTYAPWGFVTSSKTVSAITDNKPPLSESWYVELWALDSLDGKKWNPRPSSRTQLTTSKFPKVKSEPITNPLTTTHLDDYLSPTRKPSIIKSKTIVDSQMKTQIITDLPRKTLSCVLIARRLEQHDLTGDEKLANLIEHPETRDVLKFFELDQNMAISRQHDRGTCEIIDDKDASRQVYVIQTPLDTGGFWSLVLETISSNESVAPDAIGLVQVDSDVQLEAIFEGVHSLAQNYGPHPMLVPLQLFVHHCSSTAQTFRVILNGVKEIDKMLSSELENKKSSISREANTLHRKMNLKIYQHGVMLEGLRRRRTFENDLAAKLLPALKFNPGLQRQAGRWAAMAESNDLDIEGLPDKIESQRAVLFNLIAQLDTSLSTRLASESLRDSKAMKTLSILTILFLPGAFVASVFSTNMFPFRDQNQEIRIYFAIVIPLTAFLMLGWLIWLSMKPGGIDEEKGQTKNEKRD